MLKTQVFTITREVVLTYDEASPEFQEALGSYRELITGEPDTTATQMLAVVASQLRDRPNHLRMIEGVGYVRLDEEEVPSKNYSGITVGREYDRQQVD